MYNNNPRRDRINTNRINNKNAAAASRIATSSHNGFIRIGALMIFRIIHHPGTVAADEHDDADDMDETVTINREAPLLHRRRLLQLLRSVIDVAFVCRYETHQRRLIDYKHSDERSIFFAVPYMRR